MLFAQQSDFYGTWTAKISEDIETVLLEFTITASSFIISFQLYEDNDLIDDVFIEGIITAWVQISNRDNATRNNYPEGFVISLETDGSETQIRFFISKDKRRFTIPEINADFYEIIVFNKQ